MYASSVTVFPTLSWIKPWSLIQETKNIEINTSSYIGN